MARNKIKMGNFRLVESFDRAKEKGNGVRKLDLAKILWPESKDKAAHTNMSNLIHGKVKKIDISAVPIICERLRITFLVFPMNPLVGRNLKPCERSSSSIWTSGMRTGRNLGT